MATLATVNERSSATLTVSFYDAEGELQVPASVSYRIDDLGSGTEVRATTALAPGATVTIPLTPEDNAILNNLKRPETRRVTVMATYGAEDGINEEYDYSVRSLSHVPGPE